MRTPFGKSRKTESPYAVYKFRDFTWHVLKTYQHPDKEKGNIYARWLVAAKSNHTYGSWELGDTYVKDVLSYATLVDATPEWKEHYSHG